MADTRIATLARAVLSRSITPDEVPPYDRSAVQEQILEWWLEQRPPRKRYTSVTALRAAKALV